jgi:hypothetical protein
MDSARVGCYQNKEGTDWSGVSTDGRRWRLISIPFGFAAYESDNKGVHLGTLRLCVSGNPCVLSLTAKLTGHPADIITFRIIMSFSAMT